MRTCPLVHNLSFKLVVTHCDDLIMGLHNNINFMYRFTNGWVAQWIARQPSELKVVGSSVVISVRSDQKDGAQEKKPNKGTKVPSRSIFLPTFTSAKTKKEVRHVRIN